MSTYIIAEAGVNHNGSRARAADLVRAAKAAGADAVKFQTFTAARLARRRAPKAEYQQKTTGRGESQFEMLKRLELPDQAFLELRDLCAEEGIDFLSSPFDSESLALLVELGVTRVKLGSGELTNAPLLYDAAATGLPLILSTGMSTLGEIEEALGVLALGIRGDRPTSRAAFRAAFREARAAPQLTERVTLLHCVTQYPTPPEEVQLRAMATIRRAFEVAVGYSDHTLGIGVPIGAVALGATMIEKHFTLDRTLPGPDHAASLEPDELGQMVTEIR
ncbi:MAG: N-acetylneuraminate synthase family protein, partial [Myxococcota bacterium]